METLGLVPTALHGAQVMLRGPGDAERLVLDHPLGTTLWELLEGIMRPFIRVLPFSRAYFSGAAIVSVCWVPWRHLSLAPLPLATAKGEGKREVDSCLSVKPAARNLDSKLWAFPQIPPLGFNSAPLAACLEKWFSPKGKNNILFQKDIVESGDISSFKKHIVIYTSRKTGGVFN